MKICCISKLDFYLDTEIMLTKGYHKEFLKGSPWDIHRDPSQKKVLLNFIIQRSFVSNNLLSKDELTG